MHISNQQKTPKELDWVKVSDRPPVTDSIKLLTDGEVRFLGWYDHTAKKWETEDPDYDQEAYPITHWRDLPDLPEKE